MSPEQRADAVIDAIMDQIMSLIHINGEPIMSVDVLNPAPALIAQAIREAEDAALERAAIKMEQTFDGVGEVGPTAARRCRSLKSKQEI